MERMVKMEEEAEEWEMKCVSNIEAVRALAMSNVVLKVFKLCCV